MIFPFSLQIESMVNIMPLRGLKVAIWQRKRDAGLA